MIPVLAGPGRNTRSAMAQGTEKPKLGIVLVGGDPASKKFIEIKERRAEKRGIEVRVLSVEQAAEDRAIAAIEKLNDDPSVHAVVLQLPLPDGIDQARAVSAIAPEKDVDCLTPVNLGLLAHDSPRFIPPIVLAMRDFFAENGISAAGKKAAVINRSVLIGKPVALALVSKHAPLGDATVTICHSKTPDLAAIVRASDILVTAAGKPGLIKKSDLKDGAVVIDLGFNYDAGAWKGDVEPVLPGERGIVMSPVPGGMGPKAVEKLLDNVILAYNSALR